MVQFSASTDLNGITSSDVDEGVIDAFKDVTGNTLGVNPNDVNVTSVTDVARRLGSRKLTSSGVRLTFVVVVVLEKTSYNNGTHAVTSYDALLAKKFTNSTTGKALIALAITLGSKTVNNSTIITLNAPTVDYNFNIIIVQTGAPSAAPEIVTRSSNDDSGQDMTPIIIGVAVGGGAFIIILLASFYYFSGSKGRKIEPR